MEQQTLIPPPRPQIKDEAAQRAKTRYFPSLIWGGGGGGGSRFSIYFVQDCSRAVFWSRSGYKKPKLPKTPFIADSIMVALGIGRIRWEEV